MEEQRLLKRKQKAVSENNKLSFITACINLGEYYVKECRYQLAIKEYKLLARKYQEMKNSMDYARSNRRIGEAYTYLREYNEALKHQEIHLKVAKEENDKLEEQRALATIGHTYLTSYLDKRDRIALKLAETSFKKSMAVCESLKGLNQKERMDMTARLLANLGVVQECMGNFSKGIELVEKSIGICKAHDIYEQLERCYTSLGSLYAKKEDYSNALRQYNLAIEVASRLEDKLVLKSASLVAKAEILIKVSDYSGAKNLLLKAYKLKTPNKGDMDNIENMLKVVAVMCYTEDRLLILNDKDYKTKKDLYEKMGDGACNLKNFVRAIEYYEKMLQAARDNNEPEENMSPCYVSLAQTYSDNKQYDKALEFFEKDYLINRNNPKEAIGSLLSIADMMDLAGKNSDDVENIYEQAIILCKDIDDSHLEGKIISKYIIYLQKYNFILKVKDLQKQLDKIGYAASDSESEGTDIQNTPNIGEDINIDDITDISDEEGESSKGRPARKRNKTLLMKKNNKGETPLHTACIAGNYALVQKLLEQGHTVNVRDNCGWLPIHEACINGHLEIVKILVEKGAAINDRGGTQCEGIRPLHDACGNGHLDVIDYLLDKGASAITKTDNGETAYTILQKWRNSVVLDSITQTHYETIIKRFLDALKKSGHDKDIVWEGDSNTAALVTENENISPTNRKNKNTEYFVSSSEDESMETDRYSVNRSSSGTDGEYGATEQYQQVIKSLRYRNTKKIPEKCSQGSSKRPALLAEDEIGEDWLDDDLGRHKKRKTFSNTLTSTSSMRNSPGVSNSTERLPVKLHTSPDRFKHLHVSNRGFKENCEPLLVKTKKKTRQISLMRIGFTAERSHSPVSSTQILQQSLKPRPHHQMKLASFGNEGRTAEPDSTTRSPTSYKNTERRNSNVGFATDLNDAMLSIDVRINGKLYRVPVPFSARNTLTIKWLADEAAKRFCKKECMKPILELETKNGAVLAEEDCLSILFPLGVMQAEEVNANVVKWNLLPLIDRYKEACEAMNTVENSRLSRALQEASTMLDLSNYNLRSKALNVFCKAINRQANLHHLNLSGNCMKNESIELLCSALPSLENLVTLNLSMNLINSEGLHHISKVFTSQSEKGILENLINLDLSYNALGNTSLKYLAIITRQLKLRALKLVDVDFTEDIFDDFSNRYVELYLDYLEEFDISENRLAKDDILKFILWLRPSNFRILNVSNNIVTESGLVVEIVRIFEASNTKFWKFQYLNFSRCHVTDPEVYELLRLLSETEHSITLNLSYNDDLTAISLRRLLQHDAILKNLYLEGCQEILKYFQASDENAWNLSERSCLRNLRLSVSKNKNKFEWDILINMWKHKYYERSYVQGDFDNFLELSVS